MSKKVVIALGGNAILRPNERADYEIQMANVNSCAQFMADIVAQGYQLVITHGNGPQVGAILRQNEEAKAAVPPLPLMACGAQSQGLIGYMIEQALKNALRKRRLDTPVVTLLTQVEVDPEDAAFQNPTKPIGMFYSQAEAAAMAKERGWAMAEDAGRGYRRVVPSPMPQYIHGVGVMKKLIEENTVVISAGGGGIPVIKNGNGDFQGIDAVIDKDRSGLKLSQLIEADIFMMLTDVSNVYINYGKPNQKKLDVISKEEAQDYYNQGHFQAGSMGPKMEAAIAFADGGKEAVICSLEDAVYGLKGERGTRIIPGSKHTENLPPIDKKYSCQNILA